MRNQCRRLTVEQAGFDPNAVFAFHRRSRYERNREVFDRFEVEFQHHGSDAPTQLTEGLAAS